MSIILNKIIVILGPTASGKTKLAVKLAKKFKGEIISGDSRQVYKGMDIGTGKDLKEYGKIPYHLIDVASPSKQFSLAEYQKLAYKKINEVIASGKTPFLVGGTGLYIQAVVEGYELAEVKPDFKFRNQLYKKNLKQLQTVADKLKIKLNKSDYNNIRRLVRAIEIKKGTSNVPTKNPKYECLILGITLPKETIYKKIDKRLVQRLEKENMVGEVKKLHRQGLSWKRLEDFGLEYKWLAYYLQKKISYEEMVAELKKASHQYAKRQLTWFKRMKNIHWIKNEKQAKNLIKK